LGVWSAIDEDFLRKRGIDPPADYSERVSAMTFPEAADYTIRRFGLHSETTGGILREWREMAAFHYGNTVQMKPNAKAYLRGLRERGVPLAIATSSIPELYVPALRNHGIFDWFSAVCDAEEAGSGKNSPDIFLLAAQKLGVPPADCAVFEDILIAVQNAKSIGMTVCGVYDEASSKDWRQITETADYAFTDYIHAPAFTT
jgi:HAD superfamily hydrolase (TIGR01509 family)